MADKRVLTITTSLDPPISGYGGPPTEWWTDKITFDQIDELEEELGKTIRKFHQKHHLVWNEEGEANGN